MCFLGKGMKMKTMKKLWFVALLATLLALCFCVMAGAETVSGTGDDGLAWSLNTETGALAVNGTGKMKNYTDPAKTPWSAYSDSIKTVTVESGVTSVGRWAFSGCEALTTVILPEGLTAISYGAFENCVALTSVKLPSTLKSINYGAFQNCKSLVSIELPAGLTVLEGKAFAGCSALESVTLPAGVTELKWGVFEGCTALKNLPIHDAVKSIDSYAFKDCETVRTATLPMTLKSIGSKAFEKCASLVKLVVSSILPYGESCDVISSERYKRMKNDVGEQRHQNFGEYLGRIPCAPDRCCSAGEGNIGPVVGIIDHKRMNPGKPDVEESKYSQTPESFQIFIFFNFHRFLHNQYNDNLE